LKVIDGPSRFSIVGRAKETVEKLVDESIRNLKSR